MKKNLNNNKIIGAAVVLVVVGLLTTFWAVRTFPTAEGWYSYYAKCILNGEQLYTDFEFLFTPIYAYVIAGFIKIFGFHLIYLRILGIVFYAIIALTIYITLSKVFSNYAAVIATITGVFYLQSEAYTVFYDYIRLMDIFSYLSILFMVLFIKKMYAQRKDFVYILLWGICSALFLLVKQNMGGLFIVYSLLLLLFSMVLCKYNFKTVIIYQLKYLLGVSIPLVIIGAIMQKAGLLMPMIDSVFFGAIEAKGGLVTILFQWIVNGKTLFGHNALSAIALCLFIFIAWKICEKYSDSKPSKVLFGLYVVVISVGVVVIEHNQTLGEALADQYRLDVYLLFLVDVILLIAYAIRAIYITATNKSADLYLTHIALLGAYFAICYGVGMSGGLCIGESALGLGVVICIVFDSLNFKYGKILKFLTGLYCLFLSFSCIAFKFVNPCYWWGIDDSSVYECNVESNIEDLKGIKLSEQAKQFYENIVDIIQENSNEDEPIYCFPHIPIFYVLADRMDPGVFDKVQWFDVSTNKGIEGDISILKDNPPKVVVIYNLYDSTYEGHESLFNNGQKSGTREMREWLYEMVNTDDYYFEGTFTYDDNNVSVFTLRDKNVTDYKTIFSDGDGTKESPYLIETAEDYIRLINLFNQGYDLEDFYFEQTNDIDLSEEICVPPGYYSKRIFDIHYNANGYSILNVNNSSKNSSMPY